MASTVSDTGSQSLGSRLEHILRCAIAAKFEGDVCEELEHAFGEMFQRGQESSTFDAGLLLEGQTSGSSQARILGIDVKTGVMAEAAIKQGEFSSDTRFRARICQKPGQERCDLFLIAWPFLRDTQYRSLVPRELRKAASRLSYRATAHSTFIEPAVPALLWPLTLSTAEILAALRTKRDSAFIPSTAKNSADLADDGDVHGIHGDNGFLGNSRPDDHDPQNTAEDLANPSEVNFHTLTRYLAEKLKGANEPHISIEGTRYAPYTADLRLNTQSGRNCFVEVKCAHAQILSHDENASMVAVAHQRAFGRRPDGAIFVSTSGRWALLLSEVSDPRRRFRHGKGFIPEKMLCLHRYRVPEDWWNQPCRDGATLKVIVPRKNIIDMRGDVAGQFASLIKEIGTDDLTLPQLERWDNLSPSEIAVAASSSVADGKWAKLKEAGFLSNTDDLTKSDAVHGGRLAHLQHAEHQARASLEFLRVCGQERDGLIYDFQSHKHLRSYAYTPWAWSDLDVQFSRARPRSYPKEMFEFGPSQAFLRLRFAFFRRRAHDLTMLVHPFALRSLRSEARDESPGNPGGLLILSGPFDDSVAPSRRPLYAVPTSVIEHTDLREDFVAESKWKMLGLKQGYRLHRFHFDDYERLIRDLSSAFEDVARSEHGRIAFCGVDVALSSRQEIFEEMMPGYQKWLT